MRAAASGRDRFTDERVDDDFCGTGATVQVVAKGVFNGWEGEDTLKLPFRQSIAFTYGETTQIWRCRGARGR